MSAPKRKDPSTALNGEQPAKKFKSEKASKDPKARRDGAPKSKDYPPRKDDKAGGRDKNVAPNKVFNAKSSAEAHAMQRTLAKERKASKPNADSIGQAKKIWEKLRRKSHVAKDEREKLVTELFDIITGRVVDFVFKHDSVRTIQCGIKYGNLAQRKQIATELRGNYKELARSKYAKFLVAKLLTDCDKEVQEWIVGEFQGSVKALINHPEASWILDDTYRGICTKKQKAMLLREWYGTEFAIAGFADPKDEITADLSAILEQHPEKRKPIVDHLWAMINPLIQKKMTAFTMLHDALLQYSLVVGAPGSSEAASELQENLKPDEDDDGDLLKNLAFTKSGARVVCRALAFGNAKDRRNMLRPFKEHVQTMAYDARAMSVLLAAYECVDDTRLVSKLILPALLSSDNPDKEARYVAILDCMHNGPARTALMYPIIGFKLKLQDSAEVTALVDEVRELRTATSKKDPETRRQELAKWLIEEGVLFDTIEQRAADLVGSTEGCRFISELAAAAPAEIQRALDAVAALAAGDPADAAHLAHSVPAGTMLKTLVSSQRFDRVQKQLVPVAPRLGFAEKLFGVIQAHLVAWACSPSSFVIANMLQDDGFGERAPLVKALKKGRKQIEQAAAGGNKGSQLVVDSL